MRNRIIVLGFFAAAAALFCARDVSAGDEAARVADLVDELSDPDPRVRATARKQLVLLGAESVPQLVAVLKGGEALGRSEAVQVLAALGPVARDASPALADGAKEASGAARMPFLRALAAVDPAGSCTFTVPILLSFLDDRDPALRLEAATALRGYGPAASGYVPKILAKFPYAEPPVRAVLIEAVRAMGVEASESVVDLYTKGDDSQRAALAAVIAELGDSVVPVATWRLKSEEKTVRASAAQVLGLLGASARGATPELVAALSDEAGVVRRRAADALGAIGADPKLARPALAALLDDPTARAQVEAAAAIARVAVPDGVAADFAPEAPEVARAVERGLDWLDRHRTPGGGWSAAGFRERCEKATPCGGVGEQQHDVGLTGLATLAFLGAGETQSKGAHRELVAQSLKALRESQDQDGCFGPRTRQHWVYSHASAALAVVDAYRRTGSKALQGPAERAVQFTLKCQNPYLGWRYSYPRDGDNDTSSTGWMSRVVATASRAGIDVDPASLRCALAWVDKMTDPGSGRTGYMQRGGPPARTNEMLEKFPADKSESITAAALLVRLDAGQNDKTEPVLLTSVALLGKKPPRWDKFDGSIDYYYWAIGAQALHRVGGPTWDAWRSAIVAALVPNQTSSKEGCARGSWSPDDPWGPDAGRVYSTSMALLALEECGSFGLGPGAVAKKRPMTPEVRAAVASLKKALESDDDAVKSAAKAALDVIGSAFKE
jgi:HEAT repeat protein